MHFYVACDFAGCSHESFQCVPHFPIDTKFPHMLFPRSSIDEVRRILQREVSAEFYAGAVDGMRTRLGEVPAGEMRLRGEDVIVSQRG